MGEAGVVEDDGAAGVDEDGTAGAEAGRLNESTA
jgi:hypothetical protein